MSETKKKPRPKDSASEWEPDSTQMREVKCEREKDKKKSEFTGESKSE
jgi:hypothetical protein